MSTAVRLERSSNTTTRTRKKGRSSVATGRMRVTIARSSIVARRECNAASHAGSMSTCWRRCRSVSTRTSSGAPKARDGRASVWHDEGAHGRHTLPNETSTEGRNRDGVACARLQSHARDEFHRRQAIDHGLEGLRCLRFGRSAISEHRVAALGYIQREEELNIAVTELLQRKPEFSCGFARKRLFYVKSVMQLDGYVRGLRKAGISECFERSRQQPL